MLVKVTGAPLISVVTDTILPSALRYAELSTRLLAGAPSPNPKCFSKHILVHEISFEFTPLKADFKCYSLEPTPSRSISMTPRHDSQVTCFAGLRFACSTTMHNQSAIARSPLAAAG